MDKFLTAICCLLLLILSPINAAASASVPYKTETLTAEGEVIETQTAYVPIGLFGLEANIEKPEDIFIDQNNNVYVVDSATTTVTKFDNSGQVQQTYGEELLQQPKGVYVDQYNKVYVTDYGQQKVFKFKENGDLEDTYEKPDSPLFGKGAPFKPQKVAVDLRGNIYIVGEGSTNGLIQLNQEGDFLGYYGVNTTRPTIATFIQDMLVTQRQKMSMFMKVPPAPTNLTIDDKGLVYTVTSSTTWETIRKLNIAGANLLNPEVSSETNLSDLTVGNIGNIYTITNDGMIHEYDQAGNLLFSFGGKDDGSNRLGLMVQPSGIDTDSAGRLFVTDREQGTIQIFEPTEFTTVLHEGLELYSEGYYVESEAYWDEILRLNASFGLAHTAMGQALYKQQDYDEAAEEFQIANDKSGYSDAFWEIRNRWMQENLNKIFTLLVGVILLLMLIKYLDKRRKILQPFRDHWKRIREIKLISELLFLSKFIKHPLDSLYYVKENERASAISATLLYVFLLVEVILMIYLTGFIFANQSITDVNLYYELGKVIGPIMLFIVTNYLVSTITDGEGRLRDVYIGTIYALAPFILFIIPITLVSNILTFNEAFIYDFSFQIIIAWSGILMFMMLKEIHDFKFFKTIGNILVTMFAMFISVLVFFVVYVLSDQVYDFVQSIIQEVILRV